MRYYPSLSACFSLLCLVCASCTDTRSDTNTRAPAPLPSRSEYFSRWEKQTLTEIEKRKVSFSFKDTPLSDVLEELSADTGMTFLLDTSEGEGPPITLTAKEMLLEDALRWIAALADLTWGFRKHHHAPGFSAYKPLYFGKDYGFGWVTITK